MCSRTSPNRLGFVATKPLQIMTAIAIAQQSPQERSVLCVVPTFVDADAIVERLAEYSSMFETVTTAPYRVAALFALARMGVSRIMIDSDMGLKVSVAMRSLRLAHRPLHFSLYEEGVSLYVPDVHERRGPLYERVGATLTLGEHRLIDEVWSFAPEKVRSRLPDKTFRRIERSLAELVLDERALLRRVFWPSFESDRRAWRGRTCRVYMSSWDVDRDALAYLADARGFSICKLHPHIRRKVRTPHGIDQVLHPSIPAELVLPLLAEAFDDVEVVHHGTTTTLHLDLPNLRFTTWQGAIHN